MKTGRGNIRRAWPGDFVMEGMRFAGPRLKIRLHTIHLPNFWYDKRCWQYLVIDIVSIFYHTKTQVGESCVGEFTNEARRISYPPWQNRRARPGDYYRDPFPTFRCTWVVIFEMWPEICSKSIMGFNNGICVGWIPNLVSKSSSSSIK